MSEQDTRETKREDMVSVDHDGNVTVYVHQDTREQLEADVRGAVHGAYAYEDYISEDMIIGWLDRQAEITERECSPEAIDNMLNTIDELEEKVDELTAERDCLQTAVDALKYDREEVGNLTAIDDRLTAIQARETAMNLVIIISNSIGGIKTNILSLGRRIMLTANEARAIADKVNEERKNNDENLDTEIKAIVEDILKQVQKLAERGYCYYWYTFSDNYSTSSQTMAMQVLRDLGYSALFRGRKFKGYLIRW